MDQSRKPRLIEVNRNQHVLRPIDIERLVDEEHPVRAVWEFVGRLDLSSFYSDIEAYEGDAGRSAWDPRLLISIWVYAYSRGIGSAREIERRCEYDPTFQWLTGMEVVNHHTLSDFRIQKKDRLDELFRQTLALLSSDGLISLERVMHDGTKIKAAASDKTFRREERIKEFLKLSEEQIKAMGDPRSDENPRKGKAAERAARERKEKLELALKELEKLRLSKSDEKSKKDARISVTDPEARVMKQSNGGFAPSYNAQISTESSNGIVICASLTQSGTDTHELLPAIEKIKKDLGASPKQMVVDGGFTHSESIKSLAEKSVDLIGSLAEKGERAEAKYKHHGIRPDFYIEHFSYDSTNDVFVCPAGKRMGRNGSENRSGDKKVLYIARTKDCEVCPYKPKCCPNSKRGRAVSRKVEHPHVTAFKIKMETEEAKRIYKTRSAIAEFSNAWLKSKVGLRQFCVRGKLKAETELNWACMAMNIQHWVRLKWAIT